MWLVQGHQLLEQRVCYCYALCQSACPFVASLPCLTVECLYTVASTDLQMAFRQSRQMHGNKWRVSVKSSYVCPSCFLQMLPDVPLPTHHVQKRAVLGSIKRLVMKTDSLFSLPSCWYSLYLQNTSPSKMWSGQETIQNRLQCLWTCDRSIFWLCYIGVGLCSLASSVIAVKVSGHFSSAKLSATVKQMIGKSNQKATESL